MRDHGSHRVLSRTREGKKIPTLSFRRRGDPIFTNYSLSFSDEVTLPLVNVTVNFTFVGSPVKSPSATQ